LDPTESPTDQTPIPTTTPLFLTPTTKTPLRGKKPIGQIEKKASPHLSAASTELSGKQLAKFEQEAGGREELVNILLFAKLDPRQLHFVRVMAQNDAAHMSFAQLCLEANVSPHEMINLYRDTCFQRGQAVAISKTAAAIGGVVDDIIKKAKDRLAPCPRCKGTGNGPPVGDDKTPVACRVCEGNGSIWLEAEPKAQERLLDILQLGKKGQGVMVAIKNEATAGNGGFSDFVKSSDRAARDVSIIDGEIK
jgi:hypothetical protein